MNESGPTSCGFVLYGQDGDFFVLPDGTDGALARVWSHESEGLSESTIGAIELLEEMAATPIPAVELEPGNYLLSRVTPSSQAILNPVTPQEVLSVAESLPGLEYFDQLEAENPFTHEPVYFKVAGLLLSDRAARLDLRCGALMTQNWSPEDVDLLAKVAEYLGCHVFPSLPARVTVKHRWRGP